MEKETPKLDYDSLDLKPKTAEQTAKTCASISAILLAIYGLIISFVVSEGDSIGEAPGGFFLIIFAVWVLTGLCGAIVGVIAFRGTGWSRHVGTICAAIHIGALLLVGAAVLTSVSAAGVTLSALDLY